MQGQKHWEQDTSRVCVYAWACVGQYRTSAGVQMCLGRGSAVVGISKPQTGRLRASRRLVWARPRCPGGACRLHPLALALAYTAATCRPRPCPAALELLPTPQPPAHPSLPGGFLTGWWMSPHPPTHQTHPLNPPTKPTHHTPSLPTLSSGSR